MLLQNGERFSFSFSLIESLFEGGFRMGLDLGRRGLDCFGLILLLGAWRVLNSF